MTEKMVPTEDTDDFVVALLELPTSHIVNIPASGCLALNFRSLQLAGKSGVR